MRRISPTHISQKNHGLRSISAGLRFLVGLALLTACSSPSSTAEDGGDNADAALYDGGVADGNQLDAEPADINFSPRPLRSQITQVQPMTGIVLWEDSWNDQAIKTEAGNIQLEFSYLRPSDFAIAANQYDWSALDALLDRISARKHQAILRFYYSYPGRPAAVPDFVQNNPDYQGSTGISEGLSTGFPDWSSQAMRDFHLAFFRAFAERYDEDPRIAFLQVGFGLWSEYHIYDGPNDLGEQFPSKSFQSLFLQDLSTNLNSLHWSLSIDAGSDSYSPFASEAQLRELQFGNFDDSFMHEEHSQYNQSMWEFFSYSERYKHSPHGGEFSYYTQFDQENVLNLGGIHGRSYEDMASDFFISYMIGNDQPNYQSRARIRQAGMASGYRFEVTALEASSNRSRVTIANRGIAPIYYDAYPTVNGQASEESLKGLLPGAEKLFEIEAGGESLDFQIAAERLVEGQVIQFEASLLAQ